MFRPPDHPVNKNKISPRLNLDDDPFGWSIELQAYCHIIRNNDRTKAQRTSKSSYLNENQYQTK
jgi:hypothetical protein